jgi:myo-inositol 2-dehydrogenase/D-chiro-inositol 1-dehydrogenase
MNMVTRLALLGAGRIGKVHATGGGRETRSAKAGGGGRRLRGGREGHRRPDRWRGEVRSIEAIEKAAKDIDAVIICTPTDTHADLIERFAKAGKAIFCEKPDRPGRRTRVEKPALRPCVDKSARQVLMVGFNRRFDPHFAGRAQGDRRRRSIGKVEHGGDHLAATRARRRPTTSSVSGGIFRDMTIHDFDMARFLLGEEISGGVRRSASVLVDPEDRRGSATIDSAPQRDPGRRSVRPAGDHLQFAPRHPMATTSASRCTARWASVAAENQRPVSIEVASEEGYTRPPLHDFFMTRYIGSLCQLRSRPSSTPSTTARRWHPRRKTA